MVKEKKVKKRTVEEKKEEAGKKEEEAGEKKRRVYEKHTKTAVIIMIVIIASIFLAHWISQEIRRFEYGGIEFYKEKEGSITYYKSLLGYVTATGEVPFLLKLRHDPRESGRIPIEGTIRLKKEVVLSLSPEVTNCSNTYVTLVDFGMVLKAFSIKARAATTDRKYAREHNAALADCKDTGTETVIVMKEGNETKITQDKDCYVIEIKDCEIRQGFERFMFEFIRKSLIGR